MKLSKKHNKKCSDTMLEIAIITALAAVFIAILIIIWIDLIIGLKILGTALTVLIAAVVITIATKEDNQNGTGK